MTIPSPFEQIALEHAGMIRRIAASYEAEVHLAEELVQDIYFALWRALPSFRGDSSLRTFVARIATNRAVTHVARAARAPLFLELDDQIPAHGDTVEGQAIRLDNAATLLSAIRRLPLSLRHVATLTLEGLTPKEVADALGITTNAVAVRLSRAKTILRKLIGDSS
jgi:RNA polymerase sigma-70 factor (ECF subfamily)